MFCSQWSQSVGLTWKTVKRKVEGFKNIFSTFPAIVKSVLQNGWIKQIAQQGVDGQKAHPSLASVSVSTVIMSA